MKNTRGSRLSKCGTDGVVPLAVKRVACDGDAGELFVADFDALLVDALVELGVDLQAGGGRPRGSNGTGTYADMGQALSSGQR